MKKFDYSIDYRQLDCRANPSYYTIGKGEQGVLLVQPYKSEILPHWRFKTPEIAQVSSEKIYQMFLNYLFNDDFVGADMARKFLQMGFTRARRYANHKSGQKYDGPVPKELKGRSGAHGRQELPKDVDHVKAKSAKIFYDKYILAKSNPQYLKMSKSHREKYET